MINTQQAEIHSGKQQLKIFDCLKGKQKFLQRFKQNILISMKKLIYSFFVTIITVIIIWSCQNEEVKYNDNEVLNYENVNKFVKKHIEINNKIIAIFDKETQFNKDILFKSLSENCTNENEFKVILRKVGIIKFNELSDLISLQVQNSKKFQSNNAVFFKLSKSEQNKLLSKYIDEAFNETLLVSNVKFKNENTIFSSCATEFAKDKERCDRDLNLSGSFAILGCFSGPWTCALGTVLVLAQHKNCMADARQDYNDCIN
jgi:hypothetical protein